MSYLNPAEDWERFVAEQPMLAMAIAFAPRSLFMPPPGVDAGLAYVRVFALIGAILVAFVCFGLAT